MTPAEFRKYYQTISLEELLDIVDNPDHYQPDAVMAARQELEDRQIPETTINEARQPAVEKGLKRESEQERRRELSDKMVNAVQQFAGAVNPIPPEPKVTDKIIKSIGFLYGLLGIIGIVVTHRSLMSSLREFPEYPVLGLLDWEPLILIFTGVAGLLQKRRWGWLLFTGTVSSIILVIAASLYQSISWEVRFRGTMGSLYRSPAPWTDIIPFLLGLATLYILCKPEIREVFRIDKEKMWLAIVGGVLFFLLHLVLLF